MASATSSSKRAAIMAAITGLMGYGTIQYRRNNRRAAAAALRDAVEPPSLPDPTDATEIDAVEDEAHAPGHRHLPPPPRARRLRSAPVWRPRADRTGHPGRFS